MRDQIDWLAVVNKLREATELLESEMKCLDEGSLRHAECLLAWHRIMDASRLLSTAPLKPSDLIWGRQMAEEIGDG